MAGPASDYTRGEMDIVEQTATFHLVMGMTKWGSLALASVLLFFTLLFCTHVGFMGSAIWSVALVAIGSLLLREKPAAAH